LGIGPSAMQQLGHRDGENATAAAAKSMGIPFALSTYSNCSMEDVKAAGGDSSIFFQTYMLHDKRNLNRDMLVRAEAAGYKAVVLTIVYRRAGTRPTLVKSKFIMPENLKFGNIPGKYRGPLDQAPDASNQPNPDLQARETLGVDPSISWERDLPWLKKTTNMQIWVKGVLSPFDAEEAIRYGAAGIIVSNHGGRQLDASISALDALPSIVKVVNGRVPVHVDGGVRRGGDIFRALALGADFVWIGRPIWWGLHADGEAGVRWVIQTLERELKVVMMCMGCRSIADIRRDMIVSKYELPSYGGSYSKMAKL